MELKAKSICLHQQQSVLSMINHNYRKEPLDKLGIVSAVLTASSWGMVGIFIRLLPSFSVMVVVSARLAVALAGVIIWLLLQNKFLVHLRELRHLRVWILGFIMLGVYASGTFAFQLATVGEVALLAATAPIFVIVSKLLQKKPITANEYWGVSIAFLGVCTVMFSNFTINSNLSLQHIAGDILALLVSILVAIYASYCRSLSKNKKAPSSESIGLSAFILGCLIFLPVTLQSLVSHNDFVYSIDLPEIAAFLSLGLISTALPTICSATAAKRLPSLLTTSISLFEPVLAIVFAFLILQEIPSFWVIPGTILVIVGLVVMGWRNKRQTKRVGSIQELNEILHGQRLAVAKKSRVNLY